MVMGFDKTFHDLLWADISAPKKKKVLAKNRIITKHFL